MTMPSPEALGYLGQPTPADLAAHLGWPELDTEQETSAQGHLDRAAAAVRAYTRGRGFLGEWMAPEVASVVLRLAGRSLANPTGDARVQAGAFTSTPGQPEFTLLDRLILNGWRVRSG